MEFIKKRELRSEYFDETNWPIAVLTNAEKEEISLIKEWRFSDRDQHPCSTHAAKILRTAFKKLDAVFSKQGHEYDVVRLPATGEWYLRNKKSKEIERRLNTDDKIPGKW